MFPRLYNTKEEIDLLGETLKKVLGAFGQLKSEQAAAGNIPALTRGENWTHPGHNRTERGLKGDLPAKYSNCTYPLPTLLTHISKGLLTYARTKKSNHP